MRQKHGGVDQDVREGQVWRGVDPLWQGILQSKTLTEKPAFSEAEESMRGGTGMGLAAGGALGWDWQGG